jgi:hypothetical protein
MQEEIQKYTQKKGKPVPLNVMEANQGSTVTPALFLNLATKLMVSCHSAGGLP